MIAVGFESPFVARWDWGTVRADEPPAPERFASEKFEKCPLFQF